MAKTGEASILAVADVSAFAAQLQKDLNAAIAGIRLNADNLGKQISEGVAQGVDQANTELRRLGDQSGSMADTVTSNSDRAGRNMAAAFRNVGSQMSGVGEQMSMAISLPLAAAGAITAKTAGDFESMMNKVKAATEATGPTFTAMRQQAIDLGSSTAFSATEAADGMRILATAGFDTTQIMAALPAVLNMASAGSVDLSTAAEIGGDILNGYGFAASDLVRVNDVLARTFLSTATDLTDLGNSFKYIGPIAKSAGLSFEEVSAAVGLMGNAGIKGEMAGTALRGAISRLLVPTAEVTNTLSALGVKIKDSTGNMLPLVDIVRQLETSGADTADMMKIFGQEAGPGMQALLSQGSTALAGLTDQLRNSGGTADKVAKTQMQGLNGSLDELSSSAEGLMIAIGDAGLLGSLTSITKGLTGLTSSLAGAPPGFLNLITIVGVLLAAAGPLLIFFGKIAESIGFLLPWIKRLGVALKAFGTSAVAFFATPAGWVVLAIAAVVVAMVIAYKYSDTFRAGMQRAFTAIGNAGRWLWSVLEPVFAGIGRVIVAAWSGQIWPMLQSWGRGFATAGGIVRTFLMSYVAPVFMRIVWWCLQLKQAIGIWWTANGARVFAAARTVISQVGNMIKTIWSGVITVFQAVGEVVGWAFMNIVVPAVKAVVAVIKLLIDVIVAMKPLWIVIGTIIVAAIIVIVEIVKILWKAFVQAFDAIATVVTWLWNSVLKPVFSAIGTVIQAMATVIQWLWTSIVAPVLRFIGTALGALGTVLAWLWTSVVQPVWNAIGTIIAFVWNSIIMPVFNAIKTAVGAVAAVFTWLWDVFGPVITAIGKLLWTVWTGIISVVFDLLKLAFTAVWAVIQLWWTNVKFVFDMLGTVFTWIWNSIISPIMSAIGTVFTWLWGIIQPVIQAIGTVFTWLWTTAISPVIKWISDALSWLWGVIVIIFNAVVDFIRSQINLIVLAANSLTNFVSNVSGHFQSVVNAIRDKLGAAVGFVRDLPGQISGAIGNLGSLLYGAGQNVISGLIDGISSRIGALRSKIAEAAGAIRNALPFSPAKEGPLSGSGDPTISGGKIVSMVALGIEGNIDALRRAASLMAETSMIKPLPVSGAIQQGTFQRPAMVAAGMAAGSTQQNVYQLTVQSLDPKTSAQAVMEAIKAWEGSNGKGWRK